MTTKYMNAVREQSFASAAVVIAAALWGLFWVPIRHFNSLGIDGEWAIVLLYAPALVILVPFVAYDWRNQKEAFGSAVVIGFFIGMALGAYGIGILYTSVIRATLFFYLTPLWATLLGIYFLKEKPTLARWFAIVLGFAGLLLLLWDGQAATLNTGDFISLLSGVFWAIGGTLIKRNGPAPIAGMSLFQFLFAALGVLLIGNLIDPISLPSVADAQSLIALVAIASLCMVLPAIFLLFWASQILSPGRVGLLMMSEVVVAVVSAGIFLPNEILTILQWVGGLLIISASFVDIFFDK